MTIQGLRDELDTLLKQGTPPNTPLVHFDDDGRLYEFCPQPFPQTILFNDTMGWLIPPQGFDMDEYAEKCGYQQRAAVLL